MFRSFVTLIEQEVCFLSTCILTVLSICGTDLAPFRGLELIAVDKVVPGIASEELSPLEPKVYWNDKHACKADGLEPEDR